MSRFFRNALIYSGAGLIAQAVKLAQEFVLRKVLSPANLGIWNLAVVTQGFAGTFDVGLGPAMERELPLLQGSGRTAEVITVRSTGVWSKLVQNGVIAAAVGAYALLFQRGDPTLLGGYVAGGLMMLATAVLELGIVFHQTAQCYTALSRALVLSAVLSALLLPVGAYFGGPWGLLVAGILGVGAQAIIVAVSATMQGFMFHKSWDKATFRRLISYGLPLRFVDYPLSLFAVVDGLFVVRFLGVEALAVYATAKMILTQTTDLPGRLANVFVSRLFTQAGASRSRSELANDLFRFLTFSYLTLIPILIVVTTLASSFIFSLFLPRYVVSLPVLQVLLFVLYFHPQTSIVRNFWMLDRRLRAMGTVNGLAFLGLVGSAVLTFRIGGLTLSSVATAMVVGYGLFFVCLMATIGREVWGSAKTIRLCSYVAVSALCTLLIERSFVPQPVPTDTMVAMRTLLSNLLRGIVLLAPQVLFGAWRAGLFDLLKSNTGRARSASTR